MGPIRPDGLTQAYRMPSPQYYPPSGAHSGSIAWFSSGTPCWKRSRRPGGRLDFGLLLRCVLLCCMALSAYGVYYLTGDQLQQSCVERGLSSDGPVRALRRRLAEYLRGAEMDGEGYQDAPQASVPTDLSHNPIQVISPVLGRALMAAVVRVRPRW